MKEEKYPIKVDDEIYGPIPLERIISDVKSGSLTREATFWDGEDWISVNLFLDEEIPDQSWNEDNWVDDKGELTHEGGAPYPTSSAWEDVGNKGRWAVIFGDHLIMEGGSFNFKTLESVMEGEPRHGGIPIKKIINVTFKGNDKGVEVIASSFHKMYEVYSLKCCLSKQDSDELKKELEEANVRILGD